MLGTKDDYLSLAKRNNIVPSFDYDDHCIGLEALQGEIMYP